MTFDTTLKLLFALIALGILVFGIWNTISLRRLIKTRHFKDSQLNDSKYWELKYKMEFTAALFSIGGAIFLFVGYNGIDSIKEKLSGEISERIDTSMHRIDTLERKMDRMKEKTSDAEENINDVITSGNEGLRGYQTKLKEITSQLSAIQNKNIIRQDIFIVKDLSYEFANDHWKDKKFFFKNLKSLNNVPLPSFKRAPFIIAYNDQGLIFTVKKVNTESFVVQITGSASQEDYPNPAFFTIWISVID